MSETDLQLGGGYTYQWECAILLALNYFFEPVRYNPVLFDLILGFLEQVDTIHLEGEDRESGVDLEDINLSHEGRRVLVQVKSKQAAGERWTPSDPLLLKALYRFYDSQFLVEQPDATRFVFLTNRPFNPHLAKLKTTIHACEGTLDLDSETIVLEKRLYEHLARYAQKEKGITPDRERFRQMLARTALVEYLDVHELRANIQVKLQAYGRADWEEAHDRLFAKFADQSTRSGGGVVTPASIVDMLGTPARDGPILRVAGPKPECPYPGMKPFAEEDQELFFGRERKVKGLLRRLRQHPFLAIIGPSGSGKSSLVSAGLVPKLRESGLFGARGWHVVYLRPQNKPLANLRDALGCDGSDLAGAVADLLTAETDAGRVLIVADQFEAVFTQADQKETEAFQQALMQLADIPNCYVVLTVRADFYTPLMESPLWSEIEPHREEVVRLDKEGLRQAIIRPAEKVGVFVEPVLAERLVAEAAGGPGILPFVQETLVLLWDRMERRTLSLSAYDDLVASASVQELSRGKTLTGLQVAMAEHADKTLGALPQTQRAIARRVFVRLVDFGEGRPATRRRLPVSGLGEVEDLLLRKTLEHFRHHRLLTFGGTEKGKKQWVDLAHDALIEGWPKLHKWVDELRTAEQTRRRLDDRVQDWKRLREKGGGLLDEVELREAQEWVQSPDSKEVRGASKELLELMEESQNDIQRRNDRERRATRFRIFAVGAIALLVVAALAIGLGLSQQMARQEQQAAATQGTLAAEAQALATAEAAAHAETKLERDIAMSRGLAGLAMTNRDSQPALARLLSVEALHWADTADARSSLLSSLQWELEPGVADREPLGQPMGGRTRPVMALAFSPDGQTVASASEQVMLWDTSTRERLRISFAPCGSGATFLSMAFSPDGQALASGSVGGTICLWHTATGERLELLDGHPGQVMGLTFSHDGQLLASAGAGADVILWDVSTGQRYGQPFKTDSEGVWAVAFHPGDAMLASADTEGKVILWDIATGKRIGELLPEGETQLTAIAFYPEGDTLVVAGARGSIFVWDVATRRQVGQPLLGQQASDGALALSPDGRLLASGDREGTVHLRDVATRRPLGLPFEGHTYSVSGVAFSPDGQMLASGAGDGTLVLWDVSPPSWQVRACRLANRNLTQSEWELFIGVDVPYSCTCPDLPPGEGVPADACQEEDQP